MAKKNFKGGLGAILGNNSDSLTLTVLPELKSFIPPLNADERALLKESIAKEGVKEPLDVWVRNGTAVIIDGHNRYDVAKELNVKYTTKEHDFATIKEVKDWMLKKQLGRRNLTDANRKYLIGLLYAETKISKGQFGTKKTVNAAEKIAEKTGSSVRTVKSAGEFAEGMQKLTPELQRYILAGNVKVNQKDVQKLAASDATKPLESVEEISLEIAKVEEKKAKKKKQGVKRKGNLELIDKPNEVSEPSGKSLKGVLNEDLINAERSDLYNKTKSKFIEVFGEIDNEILIGVLNDMLALQGSMSNNMKLANDGYTILRTSDSPDIQIKHFAKDKNVWETLEKDFTSKIERDKRFRTLLKDAKIIQG